MELKNLDPQNFWDDENLLKNGQILFESVPQSARPLWAGRILSAVYPVTYKSQTIDTVLAIVEQPYRWWEARDAFKAVRKEVLQTQDQLHEMVLILAENVAKITYNECNPPSRFDNDAGFWLLGNVKAIIMCDKNPELFGKMRDIFIQNC